MVSAWHLWGIVAILLFIAEIFTPGFIPASFGIGCLFSALAAGTGLSLKMQVLGFIIGTLIAYFTLRPFFRRYRCKPSSEVKTDVDALIGKIGRVTETVSLETGTGRVWVEGDDWKAVPVEDTVILERALVEVVRVEGTRVFVRPV